jgi:hypothetical protein
LQSRTSQGADADAARTRALAAYKDFLALNEPVGQTSSAQTVTLTNKGTSTLSITVININGTNPADFAPTNNCGATLGAGASCTIKVTFTPTATGSRSAHLLVYDSGSGPQITSLAGTGT